MRLKTIRSDASLLHVALSGRLDIDTVMGLQYEFLHLTTLDAKPLLVDLSKVTYIGSMGIGMLLATAKHLKVRNVKMVLWNPTGAVRETIETSGLHQVIPIASAEATAQELLG